MLCSFILLYKTLQAVEGGEGGGPPVVKGFIDCYKYGFKRWGSKLPTGPST